IASGAPGRIVASEGIALREVPSELDRSLGDIHPFGNPHYLLDPVNGKTVGQTIAKGLCAVDQARCATYQAGARRLSEAIDQTLHFVAEKTGARVLLLPIMPDGKAATDYIGLIDHAVRQLAEALKG